MHFAIAPIRFNLVSPYPQFNQQQLDMRRKAEIFTRPSNLQTNAPTKKELFTNLVKGNNRAAKFANIVTHTIAPNTNNRILNKITTTLNNKNIIQTCDIRLTRAPTSSSDVPGPIIMLYKDPLVPVYNLYTDKNVLSELPATTEPKWNYTYVDNATCYNTTPTIIASLCIMNGILNNSYNFTIATPIGIYISEMVSPSSGPFDMSVAIINASCSVYFNNNLVNTDASCNIVGLTTLNIDVSNSSVTQHVTATYYSGLLTITNINLYTYVGYVYDIAINLQLLQNNMIQPFTSKENFNAICNMPLRNVSYKNCEVTSLSPAYSAFTLTGV
jgi:hypothetical protein